MAFIDAGSAEIIKSPNFSLNLIRVYFTIFSTKFGKDWEKVKESLSNVDAHEILDSIL